MDYPQSSKIDAAQIKRLNDGQMQSHMRVGVSRKKSLPDGIAGDALEDFKRTYATGYYRLRQMPTKEELDFLAGRT